MIYHICEAKAWSAVCDGLYRCASLESEGFIHCSTEEQVVEVANYLFKGRSGLILLIVDPSKVNASIRYEDAGNGKFYPHIYGPLNADAVSGTLPFEAKSDGTFELPFPLRN